MFYHYLPTMLIGSMGAAVLVRAPISIEEKKVGADIYVREARHVAPHVGGRRAGYVLFTSLKKSTQRKKHIIHLVMILYFC